MKATHTHTPSKLDYSNMILSALRQHMFDLQISDVTAQQHVTLAKRAGQG